MMQILAHRGQWTDPATKNSPEVLQLALTNGHGIETDFRDFTNSKGELQLVVSHDPPATADPLFADQFAQMLADTNPLVPIACNVKADGLQQLLQNVLPETTWQNSFVFDMSIPDTLQWLKAGVPVYVRQSEVEPEPLLLDRDGVKGIWLDAFFADWWDASVIESHIEAGRRVAIVSPELHGREYEPMWEMIAKSDLHLTDDVLLCTDVVPEAVVYFGLQEDSKQ